MVEGHESWDKEWMNENWVEESISLADRLNAAAERNMGMKEDSQVYDWRARNSFNEMWEIRGGEGDWKEEQGEILIFFLGLLSLKCLWYIQGMIILKQQSVLFYRLERNLHLRFKW